MIRGHLKARKYRVVISYCHPKHANLSHYHLSVCIVQLVLVQVHWMIRLIQVTVPDEIPAFQKPSSILSVHAYTTEHFTNLD